MENNPLSLVETLRQAHVALFEDLKDLENAAHSSLGTDSAALRSRLERTQAHITDHRTAYAWG